MSTLPPTYEHDTSRLVSTVSDRFFQNAQERAMKRREAAASARMQNTCSRSVSDLPVKDSLLHATRG